MNEKYVTCFGDNFLIIYNKKKWKKKIMGIGWGLWHRKNLRAPMYLNHQSPQPNPHTFFFTLTQSCQIQMRRTILVIYKL